MVEQACRDELLNCLEQSRLANSGLILSRYLTVPVSHDRHPQDRRTVIAAARSASAVVANDNGIYRAAFDRRLDWLMAAESAVKFKATTVPDSRLITGLGNASPWEAGIRLHHTYGVPIIPGSGLKGLAAHFAREVLSSVVSTEAHKVIFGETEDAGFITFHDAWIDPDSLQSSTEGLLSDVMTPHHQDYYSQAKRSGKLVSPSDFDNPSPIQFISVRGSFHFVLSADHRVKGVDQWIALANRVLIAALEQWGVGGKTSSGYGRLQGPRNGDQT